MRKRVFRNYSYTQADEFADYLHEMSLQGWHFVSWGFCLEFEKGEPQDITYVVEVFGTGSELDQRPAPKTEEFALYCEAAGWKFLDARRKFCIFSKLREDADEIVTKEERFQNIFKAQRRYMWIDYLCIAFLTGLEWKRFLTDDFSDWIFSNARLLFLTFMTLAFLERTVKLASFGLLYIRNRKKLQNGERIYYGKSRNAIRILCYYAWPILFLLLFMFFQILDGMFIDAISLLLAFLITVTVLAGWEKLRLSRGGNLGFSILFGVSLPILCVIATVIAIPITGLLKSNSSNEQVPLEMTEFTDVPEELLSTVHTSSSSFFGTLEYYSLGYGSEPVGVKKSLHYWIYESQNDALLNHIFERKTSKLTNLEDCTQVWDAEIAVKERTGYQNYYVLSENKLLILTTHKTIPDEQILIIKEKIWGD